MVFAYGRHCRGSHVASPLGRFYHSPSEYNGRFLRATSHKPRVTAFPRTQMWLCRDRLMIILRPCATRHKCRLCTGFTRPFWPVRCRPAEGARRLPKRTAVAGRPPEYPPGRPLRYRSQAMGKNADTDYKKIHGPRPCV